MRFMIICKADKDTEWIKRERALDAATRQQ